MALLIYVKSAILNILGINDSGDQLEINDSGDTLQL